MLVGCCIILDKMLPSFTLILMAGVHLTLSSKILFLPIDHPSHISFFGAIAKEMQAAGHDVTMLTYPRHRKTS